MADQRAPGKMMDLGVAARAVHREAAHEKMTILTVAEQAARGAENWFADSIAHVVPVYRKTDADYIQLKLGEIGRRSEALYINPRDLKTYVRWARSMQ